MKRQSLQFQLLERLNLDQYPNKNTRKGYKRNIKAFAKYAKGKGLKDAGAPEARHVLQSYADDLQAKGYTPATIHTRLAPVCLALGVNMAEIRKPKRTAGAIVRGRRPEANKQGREETENPIYRRVMALQSVTGIRRAELARLTGGDIFRDEHGYLNVVVEKGKGGKAQYQRILPHNERQALEVFQDIPENKKVFSKEENGNHINLHGIRADVSRAAYQYYEKRLSTESGYREQLLKELEDRYKELHPNPDRTIQGFLKECRDTRPYKLRGDNRTKARDQGKPVVYNRLAIMAVSVFHLSHWRLDVTVTNYMI